MVRSGTRECGVGSAPGPLSKRRGNALVTVDALWVLQEALVDERLGEIDLLALVDPARQGLALGGDRQVFLGLLVRGDAAVGDDVGRVWFSC